MMKDDIAVAIITTLTGLYCIHKLIKYFRGSV